MAFFHRAWVNYIAHGRLDWPEYNMQERKYMALESDMVARDADMPAARWLNP